MEVLTLPGRRSRSCQGGLQLILKTHTNYDITATFDPARGGIVFGFIILIVLLIVIVLSKITIMIKIMKQGSHFVQALNKS